MPLLDLTAFFLALVVLPIIGGYLDAKDEGE